MIRVFDGSVVIFKLKIADASRATVTDGVQEFYETVIAAKGVLLGILRNHGEDTWIAYATQGQAVRTLTGCSHRPDGKLDAEPLYGTPNDPQALAQGLVRLWQAHGERIMAMPAEIITQKEE